LIVTLIVVVSDCGSVRVSVTGALLLPGDRPSHGDTALAVKVVAGPAVPLVALKLSHAGVPVTVKGVPPVAAEAREMVAGVDEGR
jgi:hypothetical protein